MWPANDGRPDQDRRLYCFELPEDARPWSSTLDLAFVRRCSLSGPPIALDPMRVQGWVKREPFYTGRPRPRGERVAQPRYDTANAREALLAGKGGGSTRAYLPGTILSPTGALSMCSEDGQRRRAAGTDLARPQRLRPLVGAARAIAGSPDVPALRRSSRVPRRDPGRGGFQSRQRGRADLTELTKHPDAAVRRDRAFGKIGEPAYGCQA